MGTADGYFAFEAEKRGASRVVACDTNPFDGSIPIGTLAQNAEAVSEKYAKNFDHSKRFASLYESLGVPMGHQFLAAHALRESKVEYRNLSIYKLAETNEQFDFVIAGDLIEHLKDPIFALENLFSATRKQCFITTRIPDRANVSPALARLMKGLFRKGAINPETYVEFAPGAGAVGAYFIFHPLALKAALEKIGFKRVVLSKRYSFYNAAMKSGRPGMALHCFK